MNQFLNTYPCLRPRLLLAVLAAALLVSVWPANSWAQAECPWNPIAVGTDTIHIFTSTSAICEFTPPDDVTMVEYLVVGGGGGGAGSMDTWLFVDITLAGSGGNAGEVVRGELPTNSDTSYTVAVGAEGAGGTAGRAGVDGQASAFGSISAAGGNGGGHPFSLRSAGSGGNGARPEDGAAPEDSGGGDGGDGIVSSITGTTVIYAGGGGGGGLDGAGGSGGSGGGGDGGSFSAGNDASNFGSGGGGGGLRRNGGSSNFRTYRGGNGTSGVVIIRYASPAPPSPWAEFRMDETNWSGTTGEVADSSGNNRDGTAQGNAETAGDEPAPACRYGTFDGDNDYVEIDGLSDVLNGSASMAFWIKTRQTGSDEDNTWESPGIAGKEVEDEPNADIFWGWIDSEGHIGISVGNDSSTTSDEAINDGSWHHVVLTRDVEEGIYQVYVDGDFDVDGRIATPDLDLEYSSIGRIEDSAGTPEYFEGSLDEVRIYSGILSASDVARIYTDTHPCTFYVDHYAILHSGAGVTCEAEPIYIEARNINDDPVEPPAGKEVVVTTTSATATWSPDSTFVFPGGTAQITAYLHQTEEATLNINVTDGVATESPLYDPDVVFADVGMDFSPILNMISGVEYTSPTLRVIETDENTGACVARLQNTTRPVGLAYECLDPDTCSVGPELFVDDEDIEPAADYTFVDLEFDANGIAALPIMYEDVGKIRLRGQMELEAEGNDPALVLPETYTNDFIVVPHTIAIAEPQVAADTGFVAAGEEFGVRIEALNAAGEVTPSFGQENDLTTVDLDLDLVQVVYPDGGDGSLSHGDFARSAAPGSLEVSDASWSEVGSFEMRAVLQKYLGLNQDDPLIRDVVAETSNPIGIFYPHHFAVTSSDVSNTCANRPFIYMGEDAIEIGYTVEAQNADDIIVSNYDNGKGYATTTATTYYAENADVEHFSSPLVIPVEEASELKGWSDGVLDFRINTFAFRRQATLEDPSDPPYAPYSQVQLGLMLRGGMGNAPLTGLNMNHQPASTGGCAAGNDCTAVALGAPLDLRFGRLFLADAFGPETADLPVDFFTQYWDGSQWQESSSDFCTKISTSDITFESAELGSSRTLFSSTDIDVGSHPSATQGNWLDPVVTDGQLAFSNGRGLASFVAPGTGITGQFMMKVENLPNWLRFDWDESDVFDDPNLPTATFTFGSYRGHDRIIYWREVLE